jgi:ATP-dependent DNA ligase
MSPFVSPMLAHKLKDREIIPGEHIAQEKFDGHRCIIYKHDSVVIAWSRDEIEKPLPPQILEAMLMMPNGIYDGELLAPGKRSYGVTDLRHTDLLIYMIFDVVELMKTPTTHLPWVERQRLLDEIFSGPRPHGVYCAPYYEIESQEHLIAICQKIWDRDGEGLIIKRKSSTYQVGRRSKDWLKLKKKETALLECIGYLAGREGPYARVLLRDREGNITKAKTKNGKERARLEANPTHFIGKWLWIEFQERTPDGGYRGPVIWDRWEDE